MRIKLSKKFSRKFKRIVTSRQFRLIFSALVATFVVVNGGLYLYYRNHLYPNSAIGNWQVGNKSYQYVSNLELAPKEIYFKTSYANKTISTKDLGATLNWDKTRQQIKQNNPWLPMAGLFGRHQNTIVIDYDNTALTKTLAEVSKHFELPSTNGSIETSSGVAKLISGKDGATVDQAKLKNQLSRGMSDGYVQVPTKAAPPAITDKQLQPLVAQLATKQQVSLSYTYNGQSKRPSKAEMLGWYDISGTTITVSNSRVAAYIDSAGKSFGIRTKNTAEIAAQTLKALDKQTKLSATLIAAPKAVKQYTFCVRSRNADQSFMADFGAKFVKTLNDSRSWSLDGQVSFAQVESGCNFYAWLSAADQMSTFGAICDSLWSCSAPPNVVINFDRWRYASDAWNANNGSLDDYRSMVINHETGHWLGFRHRFCGGPGQQAPVMQQQSISLQGCVFNPWPTTAEKDSLRSMLGL